MSVEAEPHPYALGHSDRELERLSIQAKLVDPITQRFFVEAGVAPGMRVLDVGSGVGDVAFLVRELVGPDGEVVGTDRSGAALEIARRRARERSLDNLTFVEGDPAAMRFEREFDAVLGRYVLMFQPAPAAMLHDVAVHARDGGVIVFHEPYRGGIRSWPAVSSYDDANELISETVSRLGADPAMGFKLHATFVAAGLAPPTLRLETLIAAGSSSPEHVRYEMDLLPTLFPEMQRLGIAPADVTDPNRWVERVLEDVAATDSVVLGRTEIGAWTRLGAP